MVVWSCWWKSSWCRPYSLCCSPYPDLSKFLAQWISSSWAWTVHISHACYRPHHARTQCRAYLSLYKSTALWPIKSPRPTCASQGSWLLLTPKRPNVNSIHTAARDALTCTLSRKFSNAFSCFINPPLAVVPSWFLGVFGEQPNLFRVHKTVS